MVVAFLFGAAALAVLAVVCDALLSWLAACGCALCALSFYLEGGAE